MSILRSFKYRIYPTKAQADLINRHIGCARFVYNLALETKQMAYAGNRVNLSCFDLHKQLPPLKEELPWLKEVNAQSLCASITNMDISFTNFFKGSADYPQFKNKNSRQSFRIPQATNIKGNKLFIPKFREGINIVIHREFKGEIRQSTVSKTPTGKYFVSVLVENNVPLPEKLPIKEGATVGIDLGIKTFIVASDGQHFDNPKFLKKSLSKLKYIQRKYSKKKGKRTKQKLALVHEKVANQRKDFLHKTSSKLISENQTICIEDLNVAGMVKNHKLAQAISDASWWEFVRQVKYKSDWVGNNVLQIGRFDPSSKIHNTCGYLNKDLKLSDRIWTCTNCGEDVNRDENAAINIKNFALRNYLSGTDRKNQNELPELLGVLTSEKPILA